MVRFVTLVGASAVMAASHTLAASDFTITFVNECSDDINLYSRLASVYVDKNETIVPGGSVVKTIGKDFEGHFRNGLDDAATLIEFSTKGYLDIVWFDISIIPSSLIEGFEFCTNLDECKQNSKSGMGFNTPVQITPTSNTNGKSCRELTCLADGCEDAYTFPKDDNKTHSCPFGTNFEVTFCPSEGHGTQQQEQQHEQQETTTPVTVNAQVAVPNESASGPSDVVEVTKKDDTSASEAELSAPGAEKPATEVSSKSEHCA